MHHGCVFFQRCEKTQRIVIIVKRHGSKGVVHKVSRHENRAETQESSHLAQSYVVKMKIKSRSFKAHCVIHIGLYMKTLHLITCPFMWHHL